MFLLRYGILFSPRITTVERWCVKIYYFVLLNTKVNPEPSNHHRYIYIYIYDAGHFLKGLSDLISKFLIFT